MTVEAARVEVSGRIAAPPSRLLQDEVLLPQLEHDLEHVLPYLVLVELALLAEYERMGVVDAGAAQELRSVLVSVTRADLAGDPEHDLADLAFALEQRVLALAHVDAPGWHVDRSRNDVQACTQLMLARDRVLGVAGSILELGEAAHAQAEQTVDLPMPGFTHHQPAQVVSPAFHLSALVEVVLATAAALEQALDRADGCPLGAGALAGLELDWDRSRLASLLGFARPERHALVAVASRRFALELGAALAVFGVELSRLVTDLLHWTGGEARFARLPDELSGISSAMPQKRNAPVLERIRGRTAHLVSFHLDALVAQRNTPFTNLVEVSKEGLAQLEPLLACAASVAGLATAVYGSLELDPARMRERCATELLGGSTLANRLTLEHGVPARTAQVIAGAYVAELEAAGLPPGRPHPGRLREVCARYGYEAEPAQELLRDCLDADRLLRSKRTSGSTSPDRMRSLLRAERDDLCTARERVEQRARRIEGAYDRLRQAEITMAAESR